MVYYAVSSKYQVGVHTNFLRTRYGTINYRKTIDRDKPAYQITYSYTCIYLIQEMALNLLTFCCKITQNCLY